MNSEITVSYNYFIITILFLNVLELYAKVKKTENESHILLYNVIKTTAGSINFSCFLVQLILFTSVYGNRFSFIV